MNLPFQISNPHDRGGGGFNSNSGTGECRMVVTYTTIELSRSGVRDTVCVSKALVLI